MGLHATVYIYIYIYNLENVVVRTVLDSEGEMEAVK
jgi:hypothetical protein